MPKEAGEMCSAPPSSPIGSGLAIPRRILMTADTVGGVWTYCLELAASLATSGIEILLATMGKRPSAEQRAEAAQLENLTLVESEFRLEWMDEPGHDLALAGQWL